MNLLRLFRFKKIVHNVKFNDANSVAQAYPFRPPLGFPGRINRHLFSDEPCLIDSSKPPTQYGQPLLLDPTTQGVRPFAAADQANTPTVIVPYGFLVSPYPTQQTSGALNASFGSATPPTSGPAGALRFGYIPAQMNAAAGAVVKGGTVYVWCGAPGGGHVVGGLESAYSAGNTATLDPNRVTFNGPADANGVVEVSFN